MSNADALPARAPASEVKPIAGEQAPASVRPPASNAPPREPQGNSAPEASTDNRVAAYADVLRKAADPETAPHWGETASILHSNAGAASIPTDTPEPAPARPASPAAELQPLLDPAPKIQPGQPILLQVSGSDQSTASIRIADRAGTVNISVHASDPDLRDTLRSNLGDLSSQLNAQGWKTEVSRPVAMAAHAESPRDSRSEGERSFSQQQQSPGGRQQGQQRRAGAGQWRDEFEEQVSNQPANSGGNS